VTHKTLREDRYVIVRPLGEGSQGETFEAFDRKDGRPVAAKRFDVQIRPARTVRPWNVRRITPRFTVGPSLTRGERLDYLSCLS
jgi:serine/threonine protein kinase